MDVDQPHDVDVGDDVEEHVDGGEGGEGEDDDVEDVTMKIKLSSLTVRNS
jgi:hypothetical protein